MTFRLFTNDVGPNAYSALKSVKAATQQDADLEAARVARELRCKAVALPENRRDLWPDGQTGRLPKAAKGLVFGGRQ